MLKSLEQIRAKKAWDFINEVKGQSYQKDYRAYVRRASALILSNGLGSVLAFWKAKGGVAYTKLYEHINRWFKERYPKENDILSWITSANTSSLKVFKETKEVISLLNWMKKFAEAELEE
jgi:CRISPR-associated protein Cmr5